MTAPARGAFVRNASRSIDEWYATVELAERAARDLARQWAPMPFYTGHVGCHPMEASRWQWDQDEKRVVKFACND